jgi:excisionase family DNA binding protein
VADKEFLSFEEALRELRLKEEELKRLVSEGEIRAFRDGETMKLRKSDVENLRSELSGGGEVVDLGGGASEELVFEDDTDLDAGMATEEISQADTILEEDVEEVTAEEPAKPVRAGAAAPVRRTSAVTSPRASAADDDEGVLSKAAMIVTTLVLLLTVPVCMAVVTGNVSELAKSIAGVFHKF